MKAEHYKVQEFQLAGWPVRVRSYRIGSAWHAKADNVSPGATVATATGDSEREAVATVTERAGRRLAATRRVR